MALRQRRAFARTRGFGTACGFVLTGPASAALTVYADRTEWSAAVGADPITLIETAGVLAGPKAPYGINLAESCGVDSPMHVMKTDRSRSTFLFSQPRRSFG